MQRTFVLIYGVIAYVLFLVAFLYAIGFVGNILVPKSVDTGIQETMGKAFLINALLLGLFAVQHSVMARPWFKRAWTRIIPQPMERSTFVLLASLILLLLYWQWRPMTDPVWSVENSFFRMLLMALFWAGWLIVLVSTFIINHFDLFGLRQVVAHARSMELAPLQFSRKGLYKFLRHPIMLGFIIAFWATPNMTMGHLLFAFASTAYIIVGIMFEERDLRAAHGASYELYRKEVPMLVPGTKIRSGESK